jgi:hypothetical protein
MHWQGVYMIKASQAQTFYKFEIWNKINSSIQASKIIPFVFLVLFTC